MHICIACIYVPCCMYCMHVYLYIYVTMHVCMCMIRYLKNCILLYYSESQESPITQETNCTA